MEVDEAVIDTEGVTDAAAVIVTVLEVAVVGEAQGALEVSATDTWSPLARLLDEKLALFDPILIPFTVHW